MKSLLNNPKFVVALAMGAFAVAGKNIVTPLMSGESEGVDEVVPPVGIESSSSSTLAGALSGPPAGAPDAPSEAPAASIQDNKSSLQSPTRKFPQIGWAAAATRDPFRFIEKDLADPPKLEIEAQVADQKMDDSEMEADDVSPAKVNAVVIGPAFKLAVVDGQLLRQGDILRSGSVSVLHSGAIEFENAVGIKQTLAVEQLNLDPRTQ